ncbi:MAG: hypothetical protein P4L76_09265 [Beijerinckiaceae bacterium]|nr:hypothetical protein [Beijerinckiaceae bacterium]
MPGKSQINAVHRGMIEIDAKLKRLMNRLGRRRKIPEVSGDVIEPGMRLRRRNVTKLVLFPQGIGDFGQDQIRRMAHYAIAQEIQRNLVTRFDDNPFDGDTGVDHHDHRSRSSRISKVLSDWTTSFGVMAAMASARSLKVGAFESKAPRKTVTMTSSTEVCCNRANLSIRS